MVASVEVGEGGIDLLVSNGLLDMGKKNDRQAVGKACLAALEQWAGYCQINCRCETMIK
jgi:hypothetical protein